ncbi:bifunctional methylenetetrahydrofolate dehydrogenase/cyclohydrolase, mitochondrial isoform X3 [Agelaius tricolor]|uniref:bifunctional methylenetetrahydrofolate dehydrogenase/cyclohydrolase, mitochondrial isoform X3 n=1 Tax=Agelaius tricolor TaxID=9191 RepID=UPI0039F1EB58
MAAALQPLRALRRAAVEPRARRLHLSAARGDAVVISGRKLARQIRQEARHEVQQWVAAGNRRPHLSVVLVGENPASHSYVLNKTKAAADVGISSETILRPASISEEELLELIAQLNSDTAVDGLLVQLPLPEHIDERRVCNAVSPHKDVDGFHVLNVGRMCLDQDSMLPATPRGVWEIIQRTGIPNLITADMVKEGAAVIDVGITRVQDPLTARPRLVGDVDFEGSSKGDGQGSSSISTAPSEEDDGFRVSPAPSWAGTDPRQDPPTPGSCPGGPGVNSPGSGATHSHLYMVT